MKTILQINSSINGSASHSTRLADEFVAGLRDRNRRAELLLRDLGRDPVPHLDAARFQAFITPPQKRSAEQQAAAAYSDALIRELRRADILVLGLPMYNFGIPSQLKAWIDHVARAGETFKYTEKGPVGLVTGKKAYGFAARGGAYAGTPADTQTPYLRNFLAFIGITDVQFVYAEELAINEASRNRALLAAQAAIRGLAPQPAIAA